MVGGGEVVEGGSKAVVCWIWARRDGKWCDLLPKLVRE